MMRTIKKIIPQGNHSALHGDNHFGPIEVDSKMRARR
jgi:hypothetical protein